MSQDLAIERAVADIIVNLGILPATTLSAPLNAGDTHITVSDPTHMTEQGMIVWPGSYADAGYDEPLPIPPGGVSGNVITADFSSVGYSGFKYAQPVNTAVTTNIVVGVPDNIANWLELGDPVIFVHVLDETVATPATRLNESTYTVLVQYHRSLLKPQDSSMDANMWALRQQQAARIDMDAIAQALIGNRRLVNSVSVANAQGLGQLGQTGGKLRKDWATLVRDEVTEQMVSALRLTVRGLPSTFASYP